MNELISVIIPIYNREKYLHESIESIINQTYKNLEIILVDDGSSDRSLNICKYYEKVDKRVKVFIQRNQGISIAMRNAVKISKGKYIARMDSDDISALDRYEKQLKYLKEHNYDILGVYVKGFGNGRKTSMLGMEKFMNIPIRNKDQQIKRIYIGSTIGGGVIFGKSQVFKKYFPFKKEYGLVEDVYMYMMFHKNKCKLGMLEEELYYYRVHDENTSIGGNRKAVVRKYFELLFKEFYFRKLYEYKNIIIIKREKEEKLIKEVFEENFKNLRVLFVNENKINKFLKEEILKYDSKETLIFVGSQFTKRVINTVRNKKYKLYDNLFYIVDCYY